MCDDPDDPWAQVARAAAAQLVPEAARCPACGLLVSITESRMVKVHFARSADVRPCCASFFVLKD